MDVDWQADLNRWLEQFVAALWHKMRARMCPAYIAGLIDLFPIKWTPVTAYAAAALCSRSAGERYPLAEGSRVRL
jgi:hypothetical protein